MFRAQMLSYINKIDFNRNLSLHKLIFLDIFASKNNKKNRTRYTEIFEMKGWLSHLVKRVYNQCESGERKKRVAHRDGIADNHSGESVAIPK